MEQAYITKILTAIKKDDVKAFNKLISPKLLNLCLGRFPLLSLCYMYQSTLILSKYEKQLILVTSQNYSVENEPVSIYSDFKKIAGKALRLFTVNVISPAEMLALMGLSDKLSFEWEHLEKNVTIIANVQKIFRIVYQADCVANEQSINVPKVKGKSHSSNILYKFAIIALCFAVLFSGILGGTLAIFGSGTTFSNVKAYSSKIFMKNVASFVTLQQDLDLSGMSPVEKVGTINGNNKKITVDSLDLFGTIEGSVYNLTIELKLNYAVSQVETALFKANNGTIDNVKVIVNGIVTETDAQNDLLISTLVGENNGTISNTHIEGNLRILGNAKGNASYSAFASTNNGSIKNSELVDGSITSENVDIAGFTVTNNGTIDNVINSQSIKQDGTGELEENYAWNPNCTGIAITNYGTILNAQNSGDIKATSDTDKVYQIIISGVAINNYGTIQNSSNTGNLDAASINCSALVGGITACNYATYSDLDKLIKSGNIKECVNKGNIYVSNKGLDNSELLTGGISSVNQGKIELCDNFGKIKTTTTISVVYSAGVVALNTPFSYNGGYAYSTVNACSSESEIQAVIEQVADKTINLFGGIVARNQCYLTSCYSFNSFSISIPQRVTINNDEEISDNQNGNDENTSQDGTSTDGESKNDEETNESENLVPTYFIGSISGLAYVTLNITGGLVSTTSDNYGFSENSELKPIGAFAYNNSLINNVNDALNSSFTDKEAMINFLKEKGLYRND